MLTCRLKRPAYDRIVRETGGSSAVEFSLLAPVFLMLAFGIIVYGLYFGAAHALQEMAAEAARTSVAGLSADERNSLARQSVDRALAGPSLFRAEDVAVQVGDDPADRDVYVVTLTYDSRSMGFARYAGLVPIPPAVLTRTFRVRRGGL